MPRLFTLPRCLAAVLVGAISLSLFATPSLAAGTGPAGVGLSRYVGGIEDPYSYAEIATFLSTTPPRDAHTTESALGNPGSLSLGEANRVWHWCGSFETTGTQSLSPSVTSDDYAFVTIDDELVVDKPGSHDGTTTASGTATVDPGQHHVDLWFGKDNGAGVLTVTGLDGLTLTACEEAPILTLNGPSVVSVPSGIQFDAVTAIDRQDGDITSNVTSTPALDVNTPGTYNVTYSVADRDSNTATSVTQTINVVESERLGDSQLERLISGDSLCGSNGIVSYNAAIDAGGGFSVGLAPAKDIGIYGPQLRYYGGIGKLHITFTSTQPMTFAIGRRSNGTAEMVELTTPYTLLHEGVGSTFVPNSALWNNDNKSEPTTFIHSNVTELTYDQNNSNHRAGFEVITIAGLGVVDSDCDSLSDADEAENGLNPYVANSATDDADNDGITDIDEISDGLNPTNADTDNDGITDGDEVNTHGTDPTNADTDNDGITDGDEVEAGLSPTQPNPPDADTDNDGITDIDEVNTHGTDPTTNDTDNDGITDNDEIEAGLNPTQPNPPDADTDNDGITDIDEVNTHGTDPTTNDTDNDGITDNDEIEAGLNPTQPNPPDADTDNDGITDIDEVNTHGTDPTTNDTDNDGITDNDEIEAGLNPTQPNPPDADTDNDGITDIDEVNTHGTDPTTNDTDNDGITDNDEIEAGLNPTQPNPPDADTDNDGITDIDEVNTHGTDPTTNDTDNDGITDNDEIEAGLNPTTADGVQVSGRIFLDADRDADIGEVEGVDVSGVQVQLFGAGSDATLGTADDVLVATATTASPFVFTDVLPGKYRLQVDPSTLPFGYVFTGTGSGIVDVAEGNVALVGKTLSFGVNHAQINGIITDKESNPVAGQQVVVTSSDGSVFTATTDTSGRYVITGSDANPLSLGEYTVSVNAGGATATTKGQIGLVDNGRSPDLIRVEVPQTEQLAFTGASSHSTFLLVGFGLVGCGSVLTAQRRRRLSIRQR